MCFRLCMSLNVCVFVGEFVDIMCVREFVFVVV